MRKISDIIIVIASLVLIIALSFEIIGGDHLQFKCWYVVLQGVICTLYIAKFFINMNLARQKLHYFYSHIPILIISIPYLNFINHADFSREIILTLGLLPILRAMVSFYRIFHRLVTAQSFDKIFYAYILVTILVTYIAALIFYDCEYHINSELNGFGNAIWWSWMGLTTVGAEISPVTTLGKVLSVILPLLGMMLLPIFTSYIISLHKRK